MINIPYGNYASQGQSMSAAQQSFNMPQTNRYIYVNNRVHNAPPATDSNTCQKVLVNPHFKPKNKVFVNPNFAGIGSIHVNPLVNMTCKAIDDVLPQVTSIKSTKIHINPNMKPTSVHINPKFANATVSLVKKAGIGGEAKENILVPVKPPNNLVVLTKTKLVRGVASTSDIHKKKRRNSVKSKYKIVKTGLSPKKTVVVVRSNEVNSIKPRKTRFKINNLPNTPNVIIKDKMKYVYVNKLAKTKISRRVAVLKPAGRYVSPGCNTQRTLHTRHKLINKNCPKVKKTSELKNKIVKKFKIIRRQSPKKKADVKVSPRKLRKCNIPCPSYRKFGICKAKDFGKCFWKHDPDQIALCTRFLQGACVKEKCLLSHNVSPEKMPTCKYFLEGSCSRDNCSYLHVKISRKAEVCRDFLEGFCKQAAECDKRHQYLCPDYEKYGKCVKQRCPYPHGKMVRTYTINKNKFAKKSSEQNSKTKKNQKIPPKSIKKPTVKEDENSEQKRYYVDKSAKIDAGSSKSENANEENNEECNLKTFIGLQSRPKLGSLPAFIPFKES